MNESPYADLFFATAAIAVGLVGSGMLVVLFYSTLILREVLHVVRKVRHVGDELEQDFEGMRDALHAGISSVKNTLRAAFAFMSIAKRKQKHKRKRSDSSLDPNAEATNIKT